MPQPYFVPVRPSVSRSTHRSGVSRSTSISCGCPLIVRRGIMLLLDRLAAPSRERAGADYRPAKLSTQLHFRVGFSGRNLGCFGCLGVDDALLLAYKPSRYRGRSFMKVPLVWRISSGETALPDRAGALAQSEGASIIC